MADGIELGKAYVQIVPSAKGIKDSIVEELGEIIAVEPSGDGARTDAPTSAYDRAVSSGAIP